MKNGLIVTLALAAVGLGGVAWMGQQQALQIVAQEQALRQEAEEARGRAEQAHKETLEARALLSANNGGKRVVPSEGAAATTLEARETLETRHLRSHAQVQRARSLLARDPVAAAELLEDEMACPPDLRDFTWHLAHRLTRRERLVVPDAKAVALSIDGRTLAVARADGSVTVHQTTTGSERARLTTPAVRLAVSLDGNRIATDDDKGGLQLWDLDTAKPITLKGDPKARLVGFAPDGTTVVGCTDQQVLTWKLPSGEPGPRHAFRTTRALVSTEDGAIVSLVGAGDGLRIARLDLATGMMTELPVKLEKGLDPDALLLSSDGRSLASVRAGKVVVWDGGTGQERLTLELAGKGVPKLGFTAYGQVLTTWMPQEGRLRVWDLTERQPRLRLAGLVGPGNLLECSRDGQVLAVGTTRGAVVLDLGADPTRLARPPFQRTPGTPAALAADGSRLALCDQGNVFVWDLQDAARNPIAAPLPGNVTRLLFAPGNRWLAAQIEPKTVRIFDFKEEQKVRTFDLEARLFAFSRDGQTLTTVAPSGLVQRWETATFTEKHSGKIEGEATLSADGVTLAVVTADSRKVKLLDAAPLRERGEVSVGEAGLADLLFTEDGNSLFTRTKDGRVARWDAGDGRPRPVPVDLTVPLDTCPLWTVSRDGQFVATAARDGRVRVWDLAAGRLAGTSRSGIRPEQGDELTGLTLSPDGLLLTLTGREKDGPVPVVQFFDGATAQEVGHNLTPPGPVEWLAFAADGRTLALGSRNALTVWTTGGGK